LDNAGLRVLSMSPFEVGRTEAGAAYIYVFAVQDSANRRSHRPRCARRGAGRIALLAVGSGETMNDGLNALVLDAGLVVA
jgi:NAD-specific glutamate dehydrogenase